MEPALHIKEETGFRWLNRSETPLTLPSLCPCHVACCHDRVNFHLYSGMRRYQHHWHSVLLSWHPLKGMSRLFWHCCISIRCFVSRDFKTFPPSSFSSCQWGWPNARLLAVLLSTTKIWSLCAYTVLNWWTALVSLFMQILKLCKLLVPYGLTHISFLFLKCWDWVVPSWLTFCSSSSEHMDGCFMTSILLPPYNIQLDKKRWFKNCEPWVS